MAMLFRPFLALLIAVTLLGATVAEIRVGLAAEIAAVAEPCCEGDCPEVPACDSSSCAMMLRCAATAGILVLPSVAGIVPVETAANLLLQDQSFPSGHLPDGVRRPPKA
ncbi:MAG: hypothetical protein NW217_13320 [Hyphomicrobiaceae bacterium]|nr:hypothetical protein [Hyphomicrobiaceae bacterium]